MSHNSAEKYVHMYKFGIVDRDVYWFKSNKLRAFQYHCNERVQRKKELCLHNNVLNRLVTCHI